MKNNTELFDVVDENDRVIDCLPRQIVHQRQLLHRAVHVFVFRSDGCLLIHLRTETKEEFPGVWTSSASGHVSAGEDYDEAARRELLEELGIAAPLQRIHKFSARQDTSNEFTVLYKTTWNDAIKADPREIADVRWQNPVVIQQLIKDQPFKFSPCFRLLFSHFMDGKLSDS